MDIITAPRLFKCTLTRISGGQALRDDVIEGEAIVEPTLNRSFYMRGAARDAEPGTVGWRLVNTSPLTEIKKTNNGWLLTTQSGSQYFLGKVEE